MPSISGSCVVFQVGDFSSVSHENWKVLLTRPVLNKHFACTPKPGKFRGSQPSLFFFFCLRAFSPESKRESSCVSSPALVPFNLVSNVIIKESIVVSRVPLPFRVLAPRLHDGPLVAPQRVEISQPRVIKSSHLEPNFFLFLFFFFFLFCVKGPFQTQCYLSFPSAAFAPHIRFVYPSTGGLFGIRFNSLDLERGFSHRFLTQCYRPAPRR